MVGEGEALEEGEGLGRGERMSLGSCLGSISVYSGGSGHPNLLAIIFCMVSGSIRRALPGSELLELSVVYFMGLSLRWEAISEAS